MEITEINIKLLDKPEGALQAYCSITFDGEFAVKDLKIIARGEDIFVAMPSRKVSERCPRCGGKNHLRASYCNNCGVQLNAGRKKSGTAAEKLYLDVAHPINPACRERIEKAVIEAYMNERKKAKERMSDTI